MPLSVKDGMGAWIKDFQKSDAPQFKGKSDKERREMAMAAYLDAKKGQKDEGYVSIAQQRAVWATRKDGGKGHPDNKKKSKKESMDKPPFTPDPPKPAAKNSDDTKTSPMSRAKQLAKMARDRGLKKEDVELGEAKDMYKSAAGELKDYANKNGGMDKKDFHTAAKHIENIGRANLMSKGQHLAQLSKHLRNLDTSPREKVLSILNKHGHNVGDFMPGAKMRRESVNETLDSFTHPDDHPLTSKNDRGGPGHRLNFSDKDIMRKLKRSMSDHEKKHMRGAYRDDSDIVHGKTGRTMSSIVGKTTRQVRKEVQAHIAKHHPENKTNESVQLDELSPATHKSYQAKAFTSGAAGMAAKRMGTMSAKDAYDNEKKRHAGIELSKSLQRRDDRKKRNEEVQEERQDTAYHVAKTLRKMGVRHDAKEHEILPKIPHALKKHGLHNNKLIKRDPDFQGDVIGSLRGMKESVQELNKSTLGSYVNKASKDAASKAYGAASAAKDNRADQAGKDFSKSLKRLRGIDTATKKLAKEDTNEAKSFDQKFRDHLKFSMSKSPAVQAYMKKRRDDRDARHAKQDPAAVKKNYGPAVIPPGTAYNKASKRGMNPSQAANAVSNAFKNKAKRGGKLPK